jgi:Domain of unknown function (DUF1707)
MNEPDTPVLRAGDADREAVGQALRRHHADGRIETEELQDRISRCYSARTHGELDALLADLPREPNAGRRSPRRQPGRTWLPILVPVVIFLAVLGPATHNHRHVLWPLLLLAFIATRVVRRWRPR